jgi:polysaccharide biosynthesis/export protein
MLRQAMLVLAYLGLLAGPAAAQVVPPYTLNAGDILNISVWKEEGLDREVVVLPDGMISFPLAGHIRAAGMTPADLQVLIATRLVPYISNPIVSVSVKQTAGNFVYVVGQVRRPGAFPLAGVVDVMQALSIAGGLTPFASESRIVILRKDGDRQSSFPFRYDRVQGGQGLDSNISLRPGDVIVVP